MGVSEKSVQIHIGGMTCVNCQNKIEQTLNRTEGIVKARVSYSKGTADIVYDKIKISPEEITAVIEHLDYRVLPGKARQGSDFLKKVCILGVIAVLYIILQKAEILNLLAPGQLADTKMGYGMLFVIGLITSVHCIAMCGGINLSQCLPQAGQKEAENEKKLSVFCPALAYNMGRVLSYTVIGFALGMLGFLLGGGTEVGLSVFLQGILKMTAGLFMIIMGINMLGLFPWLRKFTIRMPGFAARRIGKKQPGNSRPFFVGILNGFMPCGPLQSMWIVTLASGNPAAGALSMFLFSLGTVPLMLGLGSAVAALGRKFTDKVMTAGAVLVVVLGLAMLSQGGSLSGWLPAGLLMVLVIASCIAGILVSLPVQKKQLNIMIRLASMVLVIGSGVLWNSQSSKLQNYAAADMQSEVLDGVQVVNSELSAGRYPNITVQAGVPVKWVIDAPEGSINGCNYKMIIRDYDLEYTFHTGENVIEFTPEETGTVSYSCWMGMIYGNIFVTDGTETTASVTGAEVSVPTPSGYTIPTDQIAFASIVADAGGSKYQTVDVALTDEGFSPAVIVVQSSLDTIWGVENQMSGIENELSLLVPYYSTKLIMGKGENQFRLYPTESFEASTDDHRFYCYIKVVDDLGSVDEDAVREEIAAFTPLIYPASVFESPKMSCCS